MEGKVSQIHTFSKITPLQKLNENFTLAENSPWDEKILATVVS